MEVERTRHIIADYLKHRLDGLGYSWENDGRQSNVTPSPVQLAMRRLCDDFERRFRSRFQDTIRKLQISEDNACDVFCAIQNEMFSDGVNWGRVVALFAFAGYFAIHCFEHDMPDLVDNVVEWVASYIDNNLREWMESQNYWQGFLAFQAGGSESVRKDNPWPSLKTVCGYAAAGIGFLTLGAFLTQKS